MSNRSALSPDASTALDLLAREQFDIALSTIDMPGRMNGFDFSTASVVTGEAAQLCRAWMVTLGETSIRSDRPGLMRMGATSVHLLLITNNNKTKRTSKLRGENSRRN